METLCWKIVANYKPHIYIEVHPDFFSSPINMDLSEFHDPLNDLPQYIFILCIIYMQNWN